MHGATVEWQVIASIGLIEACLDKRNSRFLRRDENWLEIESFFLRGNCKVECDDFQAFMSKNFKFWMHLVAYGGSVNFNFQFKSSGIQMKIIFEELTPRRLSYASNAFSIIPARV